MRSYQLPSLQYWHGINLSLDADVTSSLSFIDFSDCNQAITCDGVTLTSDIDNCSFTNCHFSTSSYCGIELDESDTDVTDCVFNECYNGVILYDSDSDLTDNSFSGGQFGIHMNISNGNLVDNKMEDVENGLYFLDSDPRMADNLIDDCGGIGMDLRSGSQPVMNYNNDGNNRIANCTGHEIYIVGYLFPLIRGGYNDIFDEYTSTDPTYLIYSTNGNNYTYTVSYNFWDYYTEADIRYAIYPADHTNYTIVVSPWCTSQQTSSYEQDLLADAIALEFEGQYAEAYEAYEDIISAYPDDPVSITAMKRMQYCVEALGWDFEDLYNYYCGLEEEIEDSHNFFCLQRAQGRSLRKMESFNDALGLYDNMLEEVTQITDSVFVLVDIENTLYAMARAGYIINNQSGYSDPEMASSNLMSNINAIYVLLDGVEEDRETNKNGDLLPEEITLLSNYPNPFNPSTKISYVISSTSEVSLKVFSVTGQDVGSLVNGLQCAGNYDIEWNAHDLSSGVYFVKLQMIPRNGDAPVNVVNKMLLMK